MKRVSLKSKGISFNIHDNQQRLLYDYANSKSNFSAYVKILLLKDMLSQSPNQQSRRNVYDILRD